MTDDAPTTLIWVDYDWTVYGTPRIDGEDVAGRCLVAPGPYAAIRIDGRTVEVEQRGKGQARHAQTLVISRDDVAIYERVGAQPEETK